MKEDVVKKITEKFKDKLLEVVNKSSIRTYIYVSRENAGEVIKYIFKDLGARLAIASGVDVRDGVEVLYHMAFDKLGKIVTVNVLAPKPNLELQSVTKFLPGAEWIEREIHELLGVNFVGHPKLERLLLADDWPEGVYPLRKGEEVGE